MMGSMDWRSDHDFVERYARAHSTSLDTVGEWIQGLNIASYAHRVLLLRSIAPWGLATARSPIEELFHAAAVGPCFIRGIGIKHEATTYLPTALPDFELEKVQAGGEGRRLLVELDGHDFHERTKEQAERDRSKDRWFARQGIQLIRFTGREVWRDPRACVDEALAFFEPEGGR